MKNLAEWLTTEPWRGPLAAAALSLLALLTLPVTAWLPAAVVVLARLSGGPRPAMLAGIGAALPITWGFAPALGAIGAAALAAAVLVPPYVAGVLLERSRSLNLVFQVAALSAAALVFLAHLLLGQPASVLAPALEAVRPALEDLSRALTAVGVPSTAEEIGAATAQAAWAATAWLLLLHTMLAQFAALWLFGAIREPGLLGRQFRGLRLGSFVAWLAMAALVVNLGVQLTTGQPWQPAGDVLFVLACAFLFQALAVVHALRDAQVLGIGPVVLCYMAVVLLPMALVGIGFADTWVRFRERFGVAGPTSGA